MIFFELFGKLVFDDFEIFFICSYFVVFLDVVEFDVVCLFLIFLIFGIDYCIIV